MVGANLDPRLLNYPPPPDRTDAESSRIIRIFE